MVRPGVNVTTSAIPGTASAGDRVGTWFIAGITEGGPTAVDIARPILSLRQYEDTYGGRVTYQTLYDAIDAYFRLGGSAVYVSRVVGPDATTATLTLEDKAGSPVDTLQVDAKGPGDYGSRIKVAVNDGSSPNTFTLTTYYDNVPLEISPDLSSPTDAVDWSKQSRYVTITNLGSTTAAPNNIPKTITATALDGGDDDRASITSDDWGAAMARFTANFGPGLVSQPTRTSVTAHQQTVEHAAQFNRQALLDAAPGVAAATTASLADSVRVAVDQDEYGALFAPWIRIPGLYSGTSRVVAPCAIAAGLIAKQCKKAANVPAAGANGVVKIAIDFAQTAFTDDEMTMLNNAGVNIFHRIRNTNQIALYGYRTLDVTTAWRDLSNQLLRLILTDEAFTVGERFMFAQIDGRGLKIAEFNAALRTMLLAHYDKGELFGTTPDDAFVVDTGDAVNTLDTLSDNQLNAEIYVRMSPFAELIQINITKIPTAVALTPAA